MSHVSPVKRLAWCGSIVWGAINSYSSYRHHQWINLLWPRDVIWQQRYGSPLIQVMACGISAPSQYLTIGDFSLMISRRYSPKSNFIKSANTIILYNAFKSNTFKNYSHIPQRPMNWNFKLALRLLSWTWINQETIVCLYREYIAMTVIVRTRIKQP